MSTKGDQKEIPTAEVVSVDPVAADPVVSVDPAPRMRLSDTLKQAQRAGKEKVKDEQKGVKEAERAGRRAEWYCAVQ